MYKLKSFTDLDKEETWLGDLSAEGWFLSHRGSFGGYTFFQSEPERVNFKIDYREFKRAEDYVDYLALFQDAGWIHVAGSRWSGNQYFVPEDGSPSKELFSDNAGKAARYRRLAQVWASLFVVYLCLFISLTLTGSLNLSEILNPAALYYTPGLWEKVGFDFWRAFIFETPFALARGFSWVPIVGFLIVCGYYLFKTYSLGCKTMKKSE